MTSASAPLHFIDEPIEVHFNQDPAYQKTPPCPAAFTWRGERFEISEVLAEGRDFTRRGRMARNMQPQHTTRASRVGSWGVGRFSFQVRTSQGRIFDLYYDRAPQDADHRKGRWVLFAERTEISE
jgi:hypothetical protein